MRVLIDEEFSNDRDDMKRKNIQSIQSVTEDMRSYNKSMIKNEGCSYNWSSNKLLVD